MTKVQTHQNAIILEDYGGGREFYYMMSMVYGPLSMKHKSVRPKLSFRLNQSFYYIQIYL